jgi:hypothetical protein
MPLGGLSGGVLQPSTAPNPAPPSGAAALVITPTLQPPVSPVVVAWDRNLTQNAWNFFTLSGVSSPGTIPRGGIKGFKRETGWDIKKGKGTQGATLTLKDKPPCEGSITVQLLTAQDFTDWDNFVQAVLSIPEQNQQASGLAIYHPSFSSIGLTTVVVKHYTGPEEQKAGLYFATIAFIEWAQPPAQSIVATVATTAPDQDDNTAAGVPPQTDPTVYAQQVTAALLQRASRT